MESSSLRVDESSVSSWDQTTDVLIIGGGCAGACAALAAAEQGAEVRIVERAGGAGGTSALSGGILYLGGGTPIQQACGFEDSAEEMFRYMMAACGPQPDEDLVRPYCEHSVDHFHWLTSMGVPFRPVFFEGAHEPFTSDEGLTYSGSEHVHPFCEIAKPAPRGHITQQAQNKGARLMQALLGKVEAANIPIELQSRCESLVTASDGSIVGAVITTLEGRRSVRARRGVVLTAGGFIFNNAMVEAYAPALRQCKIKIGTENDDGSGIRLGLAAGGEAIRMESGDISLILFPPNRLREGLLVNRAGQRFINEDAYMGRLGEFTVLHQGGEAYMICDNDTFERPEMFPIELAAVEETVADLEASLGIPETALQNSVATWNRHAERGEDPLYRKSAGYVKPLVTPPFAAIDMRAANALYSAFTLGGLHIDANGCVLAASGEAVPGLYAAGRTTSGVAKQGYSSGMSLGDASFFGRRAGAHAASRT